MYKVLRISWFFAFPRKEYPLPPDTSGTTNRKYPLTPFEECLRMIKPSILEGFESWSIADCRNSIMQI